MAERNGFQTAGSRLLMPFIGTKKSNDGEGECSQCIKRSRIGVIKNLISPPRLQIKSGVFHSATVSDG
jgi:hypothetical protein